MQQYTREELIRQKDNLTVKLKEVTDQLNKLDKAICKEKFDNTLNLLKEILDYLDYPTINIECEECGEMLEVEFDTIIDGFENLYREEFI